MAGSRGGSSEKTGTELLWVSAGIIGIIAILYHFFHVEIIRFLFFCKYYEMLAISWFNGGYQPLINWVKQVSVTEVTVTELQYLALDVGLPLKYPSAAILLALAATVYLFHPDNFFKGSESMASLNKKMQRVFPAIQVIEGLDLAKEPIDKGPWAMALSPIEFCKKHKILYRDAEQKVWVNRTQAKMLFVNQLGALWEGVDKLKPHEKAIFAALALYDNYKRDDAEKLLEQMSLSATQEALNKGKIDYSGVEAIIEQYGNSPVVADLISRHAYKLCVFTAMLEHGRSTGTIPNALYLWLKPIDRSLWYTLNNGGRKAVFVEAAAVHAQYLAEKQMGAALSTPLVDSAVDGLQEAIDLRIIKELE